MAEGSGAGVAGGAGGSASGDVPGSDVSPVVVMVPVEGGAHEALETDAGAPGDPVGAVRAAAPAGAPQTGPRRSAPRKGGTPDWASLPPTYGLLQSLDPDVSDIPLWKRCLTVGRGIKADARIPTSSIEVSRVHIEVMVGVDGAINVKDHSSGGTWINRRRKLVSGDSERLSSGDELSLVPPPSIDRRYGETPRLSFYAVPAADRGEGDEGREMLVEMAQVELEEKLRDLTFVRKLGSGSFGDVFHYRGGHGDDVAVKFMKIKRFLRKGGDLTRVMEEAAVHQRLRHRNVIRLLQAVKTPHYIVMIVELARGGDLDVLLKHFGRLAEEPAVECFGQILAGLQYLHSQGVIHRDLKPENVLLSDEPGGDSLPRLQLADFGLAKRSQEGSTICGTLKYLAPEVLAGYAYTNSVDMWSAGVLLYKLLTNKIPIDVHSHGGERRLLAALQSGWRLPLPKGVVLSAKAINLLRRLICRPQDRLTAAQARRHAFMRPGDAAAAGGAGCGTSEDGTVVASKRPLEVDITRQRTCVTASDAKVEAADLHRFLTPDASMGEGSIRVDDAVLEDPSTETTVGAEQTAGISGADQAGSDEYSSEPAPKRARGRS